MKLRRDDAPPTYRFERRRAQRRPAAGMVTLLRRSHDSQAYRQRFYAVQLRDLSDTGAGLRTDAPVGLDEPVAVCFPPHGFERGFDMIGHVVRCTPDGDGYQLAIQFDPRPAA
jgi:hypothetical protein